MSPKWITCVKPMTHNYESCAKIIHRVTHNRESRNLTTINNKQMTRYCVAM